MGDKIPSEMRAVQLERHHKNAEEAIKSLSVVTKPVPTPGPGEVLIQVKSAPCNPSDLLFLQGEYGIKKSLPAVPGWEGAGKVVASGGGIAGMWLKGKRVACGGQKDRDGTWAEYYVADANACVPLKSEVSYEEGATLLINPLTAVGLVQDAVSGGHKALVQTAAASQVGRMVVHLAKEAGLSTINIVRRDEQVELLRSLGAEVVLNSEDPKSSSRLKEEAERMQATVAYEAVAGDMTGVVFNAMPKNSRIVVYGSLSLKPCGKINPKELIFGGKILESFWLTKWFSEKSFWTVFRSLRRVQKLILTGQFKTPVQRVCGFENFIDGLLDYHNNMTAGKVLLEP